MDFHFLLRTGFSGGVLLATSCLGLWIGGSAYLDDILSKAGEMSGFATLVSAAFLALSPIIGMCLQGSYLLWLATRDVMFRDQTRRYVADAVRASIANSRWPYAPLVAKDVHEDAFFVALYHTHAPSHLIEWARRRRSYHYLGITFALAAVAGLTLGLLLGLGSSRLAFSQAASRLLHLPSIASISVVLAAAAGAIALSKRMLRDVDQMEAIWAVLHVDPRVGTDMKVPVHKPWT